MFTSNLTLLPDKSKFIKFICSIPVILIVTYFSTFIGVCLLILRVCTTKKEKLFTVPVTLFLIGLLLVLSKNFKDIFDGLELAYMSPNTLSNFINRLPGFGKTLMILSVVYFIIAAIVKGILAIITALIAFFTLKAISNEVKKHEEKEEKEEEIEVEPVEIHIMECPNCGSTVKFKGRKGTCKYCKSEVEYIPKKR